MPKKVVIIISLAERIGRIIIFLPPEYHSLYNRSRKKVLTDFSPNVVYIFMSRVAAIRLQNPRSGDGISVEEYRSALELGIKILAGLDSIEEAVQKFIPRGTVGLKTNCLARKFNSTPLNLVSALSEILEKSGIEGNNIIIWERSSRELEAAGYKLNAASYGRRCLGSDSNGVGYSSAFYSSGDVNSLVSNILVKYVDHNINLPVLKDHSLAGLSAGLKNFYGAINNPNKWHADNCDPFAAHIANLEPIRTKNRLTIIDAVKVQYHGGPGYDSRYIAGYNGLLISDDPVAVDAVGLKIIEHLRQKNGLPSLKSAGRPVKYLASAEKLGLGVADINQIELKILYIDRQGAKSPGTLLDE
jgi:uncharacterized protein (DUF362 family)